ncbi:MAG TPA: tetratricopeptide repeat protein, partial [Proteobacteria bacterium]|nr:tetratricopeptide repeat protein [Pseudomonadota bacterium]
RRMGRYPEAQRDLKKALALVPEYAVAQANLAIVLEAAGRKKAAVAAYRRYLANPSRGPGLEDALIRRRVSLIEEGIAALELRKGVGGNSESGGR